ncbi:MAG: hypothetical protein ACYCS0_01110 [bacterium]
MKWFIKKIKESAIFSTFLNFLKPASYIMFLMAAIYIVEALVLKHYYYNGNLSKILTKKHPLYGVKNFINMLVAAGTLSLALVAYLQMLQNEKFRKDEKEENKKDFNEKKKSIYKILISKINIKIAFFESLIDSITGNFSSLWKPEVQSIVNLLEGNEEFNLLINESNYFTTDAMDMINSSSTNINLLINHLKECKLKLLMPNSSEINLINHQFYSVIIQSIECILFLISDADLNKEIDKNFIDGLRGRLDNLSNKISDYIKKNNMFAKNSDYDDYFKKIKDLNAKLNLW